MVLLNGAFKYESNGSFWSENGVKTKTLRPKQYPTKKGPRGLVRDLKSRGWSLHDYEARDFST